MPELKQGDLVQLKSGGPEMTIDQINDASVTCIWFDGHHRNEAVFDAAALERVVEEPRQTHPTASFSPES
jgi:uncharacterized protein YodC (DUF2158 family)